MKPAGRVLLTGARKRSERHHRAAATWTDVERQPGKLPIALTITDRWWRWWWRRRGEKQPTHCELGSTVAIGEEAVMADAVKAVRQGVQEEATDELVGGKRHHFGLVVVPVIAPAEAQLSLFEPDEPAVGDGDAMGVAAEIGEDLIGAAEGS